MSISKLAAMVCDMVGFGGELAYDATKPDGTPRKPLEVSRLLNMGWIPSIDLHSALVVTYIAYRVESS